MSSVNVENVTNTDTVVDVVEAPVAPEPEKPVSNEESNNSNNVYAEVSKPNKKPVAFLIDVESKAIVESLVDLEDFSISNLTKVLPQLMKHVENYKNLRGPQKRDLVIKMVKHIIDITDGPGNDEFWDPILKKLVPGLIDTLVEVNDGKLKIRKKRLNFLKNFCCARPKVEA